MRSAKSIVKEYRKKGYSDQRLRALAASREEPLRTQILAEIGGEAPAATTETVEAAPAAPRRKSRRQIGVLLETEKLPAAALPDACGLPVDLPPAQGEADSLFARAQQSDNGESYRMEQEADVECVEAEDVEATVDEQAEPPVAEEVIAGLEAEMAQDNTLTLVIEEHIEINLADDVAPLRHAEDMSTGDLIAEVFGEDAAGENRYAEEVEVVPVCADDIAESASLILSAYERAGVAPTEEEEDLFSADEAGAAYIAPELTVIECEQPAAEDDGLLHFQPEYALSPEQREAAEAQQEEQLYRQLAQAIQTDFVRLAKERQAEEPQLPCADFDELARPAEENWAPEPVLVTVDDGSAEAAEAAERELAQLRGWLNELEDGLKMRTIEQSRLLSDLNHRDETVVTLGRQLTSVEDAKHALENQTRHDSEVIARTQNVLAEQRVRLEQQHNETRRLGEDLIRMQGYLDNNNAIVSAQTEEVLRLRRQLEDLNAGADKLVRHNRQLEALLTGRESELTALRCEAQEQTARIEKLSAREQELQRTAEQLRQLQLDYNILTSETLPNLQADKEELVELIGEESSRCNELQAISVQRARRSSYSMAVAAAACLLVVLTPVLSWHNREVDRMQRESSFNTRLAQADSVSQALQAERNNLSNQLQAERARFHQEREEMTALLSAYVNGGSGTPGSRVMPVTTSNGNFDPSIFESPATSNRSGSGVPDTHTNNVIGIDEWREANAGGRTRPPGQDETNPRPTMATGPAQPDAVTPSVDMKTIQVRKGEGLSQVLWRVYGSSNPDMVKYITKINKLTVDKKGNPNLRVDQELKMPSDPRTAMVTD